MMMYKKQFIFMVIFLSLLSSLALANKDLGVTITKVSGECEVLRAGEVKWIKAKVDMRLYINDRIRTKFISQATIEFDDGTTIEMYENTTIDIKELFEETQTGKTKSEMKLWLGKILGTVEKLKTRDSEFNIQTPVAIIGIRGTKLEVEVGKQGETTCKVHTGVVRMRGLEEPEDEWTTIREKEKAYCITPDEVTPPEIFIPLEEKLPKFKPLPAPKLYAQFPGENKPFINEIPDVTVFISPPPIPVNINQMPACFLEIGDNRPIELPKGITKYRFKPFLKPGPNELAIKAWYEKGEVGAVVVHFPFFDPISPIIQDWRIDPKIPDQLIEKIKEACEGNERKFEGTEPVPVSIFVRATDLGSGVRNVFLNLNEKEMKKIKEDYYEGFLFLNVRITVESPESPKPPKKYKVIEVKLLVDLNLMVIDKAENESTEIMDPRKIEREIHRRLQTRLN
ncbi:MAG: FecR family protein [bacterium]